MQKHIQAVLYSLLVVAAFFGAAQDCWGQNEITYAGVTHMVDQYGVYTNLGLGINVYPDSVASACVQDKQTAGTYSFDYIVEITL